MRPSVSRRPRPALRDARRAPPARRAPHAGHQHRARAEADPVGAWQRQEGAGGLAGGAGEAAGGHEEEGGRQEAAAGGDAGRREEEQDVLRRRPGHREMMVRGAGHVPRAETSCAQLLTIRIP